MKITAAKKIFIFVFLLIFLFQHGVYAADFIPTNLYLKFGGNNQFIQKLQGFINNYYNVGLKTDGVYGSQTKSKVIEFQKSQGLTPDGVVGPKTIDKINQVNNTPQTSNPAQEKVEEKINLNNNIVDEKTKIGESLPTAGNGEGQGLGIGIATYFGHQLNGTKDPNDNGVTACRARNTRFGRHELTGKPRDPDVCKIVSLPVSTLKEFYGSSDCAKFQGKKVEVTNLDTGQSGVFEVWEKGPTEALKKQGKIIDMTGCAIKSIGGTGNIKVRIRTI